jgi:hypothetical protein
MPAGVHHPTLRGIERKGIFQGGIVTPFFVDRLGYLYPFYGMIEAGLFYVSHDAKEDERVGLIYKIKLKPKRLTIRIQNKDISLEVTFVICLKTEQQNV